MIRTQSAYQRRIKEVEQQEEVMKTQKEKWEKEGLSQEQIHLALQPMEVFYQQTVEEIKEYENTMNGIFPPLKSLEELKHRLVSFRLYKKVSQKELANRLGVDETQVSRDERHEYYGASIEKVANVLDALGVEVNFSVTQNEKTRK